MKVLGGGLRGGLQCGPIAVAGIVKGNDEVEDVFRLGGNLAEDYACAEKGCTEERVNQKQQWQEGVRGRREDQQDSGRSSNQ